MQKTKYVQKPKKEIQVPVIIQRAETQFLVYDQTNVAQLSPPVWRIKDIEKEVIITDITVGEGKVILNGYIDKNINYKVKADFVDDIIVDGPLQHHTSQVPFQEFIEVPCAMEGDHCEILDAFVEAEADNLINPAPVPPNPPNTFQTVEEKMVVRIIVKITRIDELRVEADPVIL